MKTKEALANTAWQVLGDINYRPYTPTNRVTNLLLDLLCYCEAERIDLEECFNSAKRIFEGME